MGLIAQQQYHDIQYTPPLEAVQDSKSSEELSSSRISHTRDGLPFLPRHHRPGESSLTSVALLASSDQK